MVGKRLMEVNERNIVKTLSSLSKDLIRWKKKKIRKVEDVIRSTKADLESIRSRAPSANSIIKEFDLITKLDEYLAKEEDLWRQNSRELWLKEGDRNTKFFHSITFNRRRRNRIVRIKNSVGIWLNNKVDIGFEICNRLKGIMSLVGSRDFSLIKELIRPVVSHDENTNLIAIPSEEEIKCVVFNLSSLKAPGPDWYPVKFYQYMWDTIGVRTLLTSFRIFFKYNFAFGKLNGIFSSLN